MYTQASLHRYEEQTSNLVRDLLVTLPQVIKLRQQMLSLPMCLLLSAGSVVFRQMADLSVQIGSHLRRMVQENQQRMSR